MAGPLAPGDAASAEADQAAIRATVDLGFTADKLLRLRRALGLSTPHMAGAPIDRAMIRAVRARQGGAGSGVLDEATVFVVDAGASWPHLAGARAAYAERSPWRDLDTARLEAIRARVGPALRVGDDDLSLGPARGRRTAAAVSARFVEQVVNWQLWHHRADAAVTWGLLSAEDLVDRLGVAREVVVAGDAPLDAAAPEATASPSGSSRTRRGRARWRTRTATSRARRPSSTRAGCARCATS